jgi:GH24 family phage-related lysozyme (muramidase)
MNTFKTSEVGIKLIKNFEGCRLSAYQDSVGVWTIGYGHTKGVHFGQSISQTEADKLLKQDLAVFESGVNNLVKVELKQCQFDALVSFSFNVGIGAFSTSTLLKKLNQKAYGEAANQFLRWNKAGGKILTGLTRRREAEKSLFLS